MKTYGPELRDLILEAIKKVADGRMSIEAGETICNLAQQANNSIVAEARMITQLPAMHSATYQPSDIRIAAE
jgi:hypothetical protein